MKNRINLIIGMFIISAFIAGSAFAEGGACQTDQSKANYKEKKETITAKLNLTAEQDRLLKEAKASQRAGMEALVTAIKEKRQELNTVLAKPGVTKQEIGPIVAEIKRLQAEMLDKRVDGILKIKNILSPEQYQKLQKMKEGHHKGGRVKHEGKGW